LVIELNCRHIPFFFFVSRFFLSCAAQKYQAAGFRVVDTPSQYQLANINRPSSSPFCPTELLFLLKLMLLVFPFSHRFIELKKLSNVFPYWHRTLDRKPAPFFCGFCSESPRTVIGLYSRGGFSSLSYPQIESFVLPPKAKGHGMSTPARLPFDPESPLPHFFRVF